MAGIATDEIIQAGKNQFLLHQRSVVFSNAFRLAREVSAAQARAMSLDDMEPPPADAECPPAERVPEEEIVFEGPIMREIPEIRQFVEEGGEELTAQDLACLNPSPGGDDVIHPEYDLSIPEVARVAEIVEAANSVIDDDAAKVIEAEDARSNRSSSSSRTWSSKTTRCTTRELRPRHFQSLHHRLKAGSSLELLWTPLHRRCLTAHRRQYRPRRGRRVVTEISSQWPRRPAQRNRARSLSSGSCAISLKTFQTITSG